MIVPVILAGGSGSRLWPVSRESYPKQFCSFGSDLSLFQQTARRAYSRENVTQLIVIGNFQHRFIIAEQLRHIGIEDAKILLEPVGRDSAAAILSAAYFVENSDPGAVLWIMPSDAYIDSAKSLNHDLQNAVEVAVNEDLILLFGIQPTQAYSGYGYIEQGTPICDNTAYKVASFCEKPSREKAQKMLESKKYFWNSGIFIGTTTRILADSQKYLPEIYEHCARSITHLQQEMGIFYLLNKEDFSQIKPISFDYGVVEKTSHIAFIRASFVWSDLGTWEALWNVADKDEDDNVVTGNVVLHDVNESYVNTNKTLTVLNHVKNLVVITTSDAVLVSDKQHVQDIKRIVAHMKKTGRKEGMMHARMYRPWGFYETLIVGGRFKVKYIHVKPGGKLSLQKHFHRAEHWVVVEGTAKVTSQGHEKLLMENESAFLPAGTEHRLENPGKIDLVVIEIQSGAYLGEDDIVRLQDVYARKSH